MKLWKSPFQAIKTGRKTVEMRLFDEKRALIQVGDTIEFTNAETGEVLLCKVKKLYRYESFEKLYENHDKISIGYEEHELANPNDMLAYYTKGEIDRYGVVAIEIQAEG